MPINRVRLLATTALLLIGSAAHAGIRVEVDGSPVLRGGNPVSLASGSDLRFQVNGTSVILVLPAETPLTSLSPMTGFHTIRIFDEDASSTVGPTLNIVALPLGLSLANRAGCFLDSYATGIAPGNPLQRVQAPSARFTPVYPRVRPPEALGKPALGQSRV